MLISQKKFFHGDSYFHAYEAPNETLLDHYYAKNRHIAVAKIMLPGRFSQKLRKLDISAANIKLKPYLSIFFYFSLQSFPRAKVNLTHQSVT